MAAKRKTKNKQTKKSSWAHTTKLTCEQGQVEAEVHGEEK